MNGFRLTTAALLLTLCVLLAACSQNIAGPATPPPSSRPELESIIEPLENAESSALAAGEEESMTIAESASEPEHEPEPVHAEAAPAALPEVETPAPASSAPELETSVAVQSAAELLNAVAPEQKLDLGLVERELLRLINELREEAGVEALGVQQEMRFAARIRSEEALSSFSHTRPDGTPYHTAFDEAGFSYTGKWHGENLAYLDFTGGMLDEKAVALEMFNSLKDSPGHRRNMTGEHYLQAGIGVTIKYGQGMVCIASAQLFASL